MDIVWQVDLEFEAAAGPQGLMVWTNVYYWLQDEALLRPASGYENRWQSIGIATASTAGKYRGRRIQQKSHHNYYDILHSSQVGQAPVAGTPQANSCCLLWGFVGSDRVSFHRLKGPYGFVAADGGLWSGTLLSHIQTRIVDRLAVMRVCNVHGQEVSVWGVDAAVRAWAWRHGTERRTRSVLVER